MTEGGPELTAELIVDGAVPQQPVISPDGRWVAYAVAPVGKRGNAPHGLGPAAPDPARRRGGRGRHERAGQPGDLLPPRAQPVRGRARARHLPARGTRARRAQPPARPAPAHTRLVRPVASR